MAYTFYADASTYPNLFEFISSFVDGATSEGPAAHCEGGPCGPRGRGRWGPHRGGVHRGRPGHCHHRHGESSTEQQPDVIRPKVDVYSTDAAYKVYIALPSADKESISITYDPNTRDLVYSGTTLRPADFADLDEEELKKVLDRHV